MIASAVPKRPYRRLPDPRELNAQLWKDPEFHTRLWTDAALRDAYVQVVDQALVNAVRGKESMERVADAVSDIVMCQVDGELALLGLRDEFGACIKPIKYIVYGMILARMSFMVQKVQAIHGRMATRL